MIIEKMSLWSIIDPNVFARILHVPENHALGLDPWVGTGFRTSVWTNKNDYTQIQSTSVLGIICGSCNLQARHLIITEQRR